MADANTEVSLDALHDAIVAAIQAQFPDLATVEFYTEERENITLPACILDLTEFEAAPEEDDPQTEQLAMVARFEAEIILSFRSPKVKLEARKMAAALAVWLRLRRWPGAVTGPAHVIGCYKDEFNPRLDKYEVWRVEWQQTIHLGQTVWTNDGTVPTGIFASWAPEIGLGNEGKYVPIEDFGGNGDDAP